MTENLTMAQVVARSGVSASALRFYEERGLIASERTPGNRRTYPRRVLRRIAVIRAAQAVGLTLAEITEALAPLPIDGPVRPADWERLSRTWRNDLDVRIRALEQLRDGLTGCIGCGCLSQSVCPLWNPGDRLAAEGPGPRKLPAVLELEEKA